MSRPESLESSLVCSDRYCPKVFDPQRSMVMCRCYQTQPTSPSNSYPLPSTMGSNSSSPPSYSGFIHYGDSQTVPQSASYLGYPPGYDGYGMYPSIYSQLSPSIPSTDWSMYGTQQTTPYAQSVQMDQLLRSQVQDFWNYQQLSNQVNSSDIPATKQSTKLLKTWLRQHKKNPYPTKTEKVMLAFAARMTMTQISNWFANARRRMKQQKDQGNTSDGALSDISEDDDKEVVSKPPTYPVHDLQANIQPAMKDSYLGTHHMNLNDYLQEREKLMKIHKPLTEPEVQDTVNAKSTEHKDIDICVADTNEKVPMNSSKSKIWSVSSILS